MPLLNPFPCVIRTEFKVRQFCQVIDCTLREGNQNPGVSLTLKDTVAIARRLAEFGVGAIEVGHPAAGEDEFGRAKAVCDLDLGVPVLCHARVRQGDIDAVKRTGADWVGLFVAVNDLSLAAKYSGRNYAEILELMSSAISYAKSLGLRVRMTIEDATRTPRDRLLNAFEVARDAGADRLCIPDTVGVLEPHELCELVEEVRAVCGHCEIEVHLHDDRGLAMANALAVSGRVEWVSTSINGLGERCGIVDTIAFVENLNFKYKLGASKLDQGRKLSQFVKVLTNTDVETRRPVTGAHAFRHRSALHVKAFSKDMNSYLWSSEFLGKVGQSVDRTTRPLSNLDYINFRPPVRPASELRYHRDGVGDRYVMLNRDTFPSAREYCIARKIPLVETPPDAHVDQHRHNCSSLFLFLGDGDKYRGLSVEVMLDDEVFSVESPASVVIPPGKLHSYRIVSGSGTYINYVSSGDYHESLFEEPQD